MKPGTRRLQYLLDTFAALVSTERNAWNDAVTGVVDLVRSVTGTSRDARLAEVRTRIGALQHRLDAFGDMAQSDFLAKMREEAERAEAAAGDGRLAAIVSDLVDAGVGSLGTWCERLLDRCLVALEAQRGFVMLYAPESTEADVVAARRFTAQTLNVEEYRLSRTLLRKVLEGGEPLLVTDAVEDPGLEQQVSIREYQLRSVVVVPLRQSGQVVGALYFDNPTCPAAFDEEDVRLLDHVARFAVFVLGHARLLPHGPGGPHSVVLDERKASTEIVGTTHSIRSLLDLVRRAAPSDETVLVLGESGTGKELVARALHDQSRRRQGPFVAINCTAIPESLLESELFGFEKGSFTTALRSQVGQVERAQGGTLFLDEIGDMSPALQTKLLRFLQDRSFERVGGRETLRVDARVVAATSKNLTALMTAQKFEEALYYRLNVIRIEVPPLRERKDDIPLLVEHFLDRLCSAAKRPRLQVAPEVYEWLRLYAFPGNVREIENYVRRWVALVEHDCVRLGDLPREILEATGERVSLAQDPIECILKGGPLHALAELRARRRRAEEASEDLELSLLERTLDEVGGNQTRAAELVGVHRVSFIRRLEQLRTRRAGRRQGTPGQKGVPGA